MDTISNHQYNREIKLSKKELQKVIDSFNKQFGISHGAKIVFAQDDRDYRKRTNNNYYPLIVYVG